MADQKITVDDLGKEMFEVVKKSFGKNFDDVEAYVKIETRQLATTLQMIIDARNNKEISEDVAKILLNMQKIAGSAVLTAAKGMTLVAAQNAINDSLNVVKKFVNDKVGFKLL